MIIILVSILAFTIAVLATLLAVASKRDNEALFQANLQLSIQNEDLRKKIEELESAQDTWVGGVRIK